MDVHVLRLRRARAGLALLCGLTIAVLSLTGAREPEAPSATAENSSNGQPVTEPLVFVVHQSNPTTTLTVAEIKKLFRGERRKWGHGRNVTLVMREPGSPERDAVLEHIYQMDDGELARYFIHAAFIGQVSGPPKQLNSRAGMLKFVFNVPGAIGYVRSGDLDGSVRALEIGGLPYHHPDYPVRLPLLEKEEAAK